MTNEALLRVYPDLLVAYRERSLLLTDRSGMMGEGMQGLYEHDLRILSLYRLLINGRVPRLDQLNAVDPYSTLGYYCCPAHLGRGGAEADLQVVIRVGRFVGQGLHEDIELTNYGQTDAQLALAWELAADFADLLEAMGGKRRQEAPLTSSWQDTRGGHELRFDYHHPQLPRAVVIRLVGTAVAPTWDGTQLHCPLTLGPHESAKLCLVVATSASAGVGRAIVREFARHGARVGLLARDEAGLRGAQQDAERLGGKAVAIPTDVSDPQVVEAADPRLPNDLYHAVDVRRDYGARGDFGKRSHERSFEIWPGAHRAALLAAGLGVALAGAVAMVTRPH